MEQALSNGLGLDVKQEHRDTKKWSEEETNALRDLIAAHPLPRKARRSHWDVLRHELAARGFPLRTADGACHRALKVGLYQSTRTVKSVPVPEEPKAKAAPVTQASLDSLEVRRLIADAFEELVGGVVAKLRGEAGR